MAERLAITLLLLALCGCAKQAPPEPSPSPTPDPKVACCQQCSAAASTDPSAMDLSLVPCVDYAGREVNQQQVLDAACAQWFAQSGLMVQDCR